MYASHYPSTSTLSTLPTCPVWTCNLPLTICNQKLDRSIYSSFRLTIICTQPVILLVSENLLYYEQKNGFKRKTDEFYVRMVGNCSRKSRCLVCLMMDPNEDTYSLYKGTHFKDNKGFEANWIQCEALLKKSRIQHLVTTMYCVSPTETKPQKLGV